MSKQKFFLIFLYVNLFCMVFVTSESSEGLNDLVEPDIGEDIPVIEGDGGIISIQEEEDVVVLNQDNFVHVVGPKELFLVEFYAPWCGHCKSLAPEYAAAAKTLKSDGIRLGKVDCTVETELCTTHDVSGFPAVKLFKSGNFFEEYDGARTSVGIVEYMRKYADPNYAPPPSDVLDLTIETFDEFVSSKDLCLVEFFAPWCGHCKSLAPEYEAAATELKSANIFLAKVDATIEVELAKEHDVTGYPKLFVFRKGRRFDFKGTRSRAAIVDYMRQQAELPSVEVKTMTKVKNEISRTEPTVFAYFNTDDADSEHFEEYIAAANEMREKIRFIHTFDSELASVYKVKEPSILILFPEIYQSKYEKSRYTYVGESASAISLVKWIERHFVPLVGQRTKENSEIKYAKRPLVVVYYDVNFSHQYVKATQFVRHKILPLASENSEFSFAICNEDEFADEIKSLGLDDSGEDVNAAIFGVKGQRFPMEPDDDYDEEIEELIEKYEKGVLKPYLKSQLIPKRQNGPVKVLVAKNFESEIQNGQDFLIEFYAPWCGHCKQLEPIYKKVARHYSKVSEGIVIAKMDATANDVDPSLEVKGFPTLIFIRGKDAKRITFEGERTFTGIKDFVDDHSTFVSAGKDEL